MMIYHSTLRAFEIEPSYSIGAKSRITDLYSPWCAIEILPRRSYSAAEFSVEMRQGTSYPAEFGMRMRIQGRLFVGAESILKGKYIADLRYMAPTNWSHFLNNHVPIFLLGATTAGLDFNDALLALPRRTPKFIQDAASLLGLSLLCSDRPLTGQIMSLDRRIWSEVRSEARGIIRDTGILERIQKSPGSSVYGERVFLARRRSRCIVNQEEIEAMLAPQGFNTIYAEDHSVQDQFQIFRSAREIVAVHGAGIAPIQYVDELSKPAFLIELQPVPLVTDWFRSICQSVGVYWIGVRGRIETRHVAHLYSDTTKLKRYCDENFFVDPTALEIALNIARRKERAVAPSSTTV